MNIYRGMCWVAGLAVMGLIVGLGGCAVTGKNQASTSPPGSGGSTSTGSVTVFVTDAPADNVVAFSLVVTGVSLSDSAGHSAVLADTLQQIELRHLQLAPTLAFKAASAASANYTTLNLTLANPQITLADAQGNVTRLNGTTTPSVRLTRSGLNVTVVVNVTSGSNVGLLLDFDLQKSIAKDASGNYVVDPVVQPSATSSSSSQNELEDSRGVIAAIPANNALDVNLTASGKTVRIVTDANTRFSSDIGQFSSLQVGLEIEVNAHFQSDGTFLAREVDLGAPNPSLRYSGVVTQARQAPFQVVVQGQ